MHRIVPLLILLAACAPVEAPVPAPTPTPDTCGLAQAQRLLGMSREELMRTERLGAVRIIRPNDAVTMDFLPQRLNIYLDAGETVTNLTCG
ncbi:MAG: I78 family peptidase inhibitor [Shimia sp.]